MKGAIYRRPLGHRVTGTTTVNLYSLHPTENIYTGNMMRTPLLHQWSITCTLMLTFKDLKSLTPGELLYARNGPPGEPRVPVVYMGMRDHPDSHMPSKIVTAVGADGHRMISSCLEDGCVYWLSKPNDA